VFNLEEFIDKEFLRPIEDRCKWFNNLGVVGRRVYIVKEGKYKILNQNNIMNRFT